MEEVTRPPKAHLHALIRPELMQFLKDVVYHRSRGGERFTQQDLVNEILERYYEDHRGDLSAEIKHPYQTSGCNASG